MPPTGVVTILFTDIEGSTRLWEEDPKRMGVAHGGQVIMSRTVCDRIADRLPPEVSLRDLGSVRLRDLASHEHNYQVVHPRLRREFPALRSLTVSKSNAATRRLEHRHVVTYPDRREAVWETADAEHDSTPDPALPPTLANGFDQRIAW